MTTLPGQTTPLITTKPPLVNGFASPIYRDEVCYGLEKLLQCRPEYGIIINSEHLVSTGNGMFI